MNRSIDAQQNGELDGARGVKPSVRVMIKTLTCLGIENRYGDGAGASVALDALDGRTQLAEVW
jgi:hypothetical protein